MSHSKHYIFSFLAVLLSCFVTGTAIGQTISPNLFNEFPSASDYSTLDLNQERYSATGLNINLSEIPHAEYQTMGTGMVSMAEKSNRYGNTTSLTIGTINDEYSLQSANGDYRFRFDGGSTGIMLSSKNSTLLLSYGVADAFHDEGEIRSLSADLNAGGNISIFRQFFGLPFGTFIPIRVNLGYRNLELMDVEYDHLNRTANIGSGSLGGGLGAEVRVPTGLPVLEDNLTALIYLVASVGAMGDFTNANENGFNQTPANAMKGVYLTRNYDFNIEAKFEELLGGDIGVTAGLTLRWLYWTDNQAEDVKQVLDIISGEEDDISLNATQSFFRIGINW